MSNETFEELDRYMKSLGEPVIRAKVRNFFDPGNLKEAWFIEMLNRDAKKAKNNGNYCYNCGNFIDHNPPCKKCGKE